MMNTKLTAIGRILFALPFGILGLNHFFMKSFYLGMVSTFIPGSGFGILLVGAVLIAASVSILLNKMVKQACWTLSVLLFLFIVTIHIPNLFISDNFTITIIELMKDTGLLGGALVIASTYKE
jgi:uncharacterized membrane protein